MNKTRKADLIEIETLEVKYNKSVRDLIIVLIVGFAFIVYHFSYSYLTTYSYSKSKGFCDTVQVSRVKGNTFIEETSKEDSSKSAELKPAKDLSLFIYNKDKTKLAEIEGFELLTKGNLGYKYLSYKSKTSLLTHIHIVQRMRQDKELCSEMVFK